jgi:2',3'-cyclic-nucleotide 2'-phosphodiesterase (5'-nucleotidase family)
MSGKGYVSNQQVTIGGNTETLLRPIDTVVGYTQVDFFRRNFSDDYRPGVVEGTSHNFFTDAFRWAAGTDIATMRGFRYGTDIKANCPITMNDIYHFIPVAARIAKAFPVYGNNIKTQIENSSDKVFNPDPTQWGGGWLFGYSGVSFDLDVFQPLGSRGSNIKVNGVLIDPNATATTVGAATYSVAGYWYADDPNTINNCSQCSGGTVTPLTDANGAPLFATEIVVRYLQSLPNHSANPTLGRINLLKPLPPALYGFPIIQPLQGAQ